jgi:hypothetical protein
MQVPVQNPIKETPPQEVEAITRALAAPFDPAEVKFKPGVVSGNRALALAYVDARVIQDRLDEVLGVMGWQDSYKVLPDGSVMCRLRIRIGGQWITKVDVGGQSEQPDGGDRTKAAFSEALKRAAVKFGVGRYLYRLPGLWCDYDPHKRQFVRPPTLPASALPPKAPKQPASTPAPAQPAKAATEPNAKREPTRKSGPRIAGQTLPSDGADLQRRLSDYDSRLAAQGVFQKGDLLKHIIQAGVRAGYGADLTAWTGPAIRLAVNETRAFEKHCREKQGPRKEVA